MSQTVTEPCVAGAVDSREYKIASSKEGCDEASAPRIPRLNIGSAPWLFTTLCNVDDATRGIIERATHALLHDDGSRRDFTHISLRLLEEALATGCPDALILKGIAMERLADDPISCLREAENKGSIHPLLYYNLGKHYMRKREYDKGLGYIDQATKCKYLCIYMYIRICIYVHISALNRLVLSI